MYGKKLNGLKDSFDYIELWPKLFTNFFFQIALKKIDWVCGQKSLLCFQNLDRYLNDFNASKIVRVYPGKFINNLRLELLQIYRDK